jgi:hypothetical protein
VSAAYGSASSPQVQRLVNLRDAHLRGSVLGQLIFEHLSAEYYQVSPQLAADMRQSTVLLTLVSRLIVEPLVAFVASADGYLGDDEVVDDQVLRIFETTRSWLGDHAAERLQLILGLVRGLSRPSSDNWVEEGRFELTSDYWVEEVRATLDHVRRVIERSVEGSTYLSWALVGSVAGYWSVIGSVLGATFDADQLKVLAPAIEEWLAELPLPPEYADQDEDVVRRDLRWLAGQITRPSARIRIGHRLLAAYQAPVRYNLRDVLVETGFLPPPDGGV